MRARQKSDSSLPISGVFLASFSRSSRCATSSCVGSVATTDAARGASLTSAFMLNPEPMLELLGVPKDSNWLFSCCVSLGYPTGRWGVAPRRPVHEVSYRNHWGEPVGFEVPEPLWSGS